MKHDGALENLKQEIKYRTHDYVRRQLVWFRRNKSILWIKTPVAAKKLTVDFLKR